MTLLLVLYAQSDGAISPSESTKLFNGKDLSGFHTWLVDTKREDPRGVYGVQHGMIRMTGDGFGYLATEKLFRDYRLVVEFKWGQRAVAGRESWAKDSGLFVHAIGADGNSYDGKGAYMGGIEVQIMQGATGDLMLIAGKDEKGKRYPIKLTAETGEKDRDGYAFWKKGGAEFTLERFGRVNWFGKDVDWKNASGFKGRGDVEKNDDWNRVECVCKADRISVTVNGTRVNEAREVWPSAGRILLQCEGFEIFFKTVELHPLKE